MGCDCINLITEHCLLFFTFSAQRPSIVRMIHVVGQGPTVLAVGANRLCLNIFSPLSYISSLSPSHWNMAQYRLKYFLKEPFNLKQPTNCLIRSLI